MAGVSGTPLLVLISGPSGAGKDAIVERLVESKPDKFKFVITCTSRKPRASEADGKDYEFTTAEKFKAMIGNNELLEHAKVYNNYYGSRYGAVEQVLAQSKHALMRIDVQGATRIKELVPEAACIFVMPSSREALKQRLEKRDGSGTADFERRLRVALSEIAELYFSPERKLVYNIDGQLQQAADEVERLVDEMAEGGPDALPRLRGMTPP